MDVSKLLNFEYQSEQYCIFWDEERKADGVFQRKTKVLFLLFKFQRTIWNPFTSKIGEGNGNPLQPYCLKNPMDRGAWQATVHGVTKSQTWLRD